MDVVIFFSSELHRVDNCESVFRLESCYTFQQSLSDNLTIYDTDASVSNLKPFYGYTELELHMRR